MTRTEIIRTQVTAHPEMCRYVVYVAGNHASLGDSDKVIGYVDLTGDGNVASVSAEFSFTPDATHGLFKIGRTVSL